MKQNKQLPLISVVVLNWNGKRFIDSFMKSIAGSRCEGFELEVLFTDNNSSDDSVEYYREKYLDNHTYKLVANDGNYGYAKGNNLGMIHAKGEYVLVCNNDLELDKDCIYQLFKTITETKADLAVPKLMFLNRPGVINNAGSKLRPDSNWPIEEIGANEPDNGQYEQVATVTAFCGACVLYKRSFLESVGLYDKRFFMYFEDGDLSWRGQTMGRKYLYVPKAIANHYHTGSSKEGSPLFVHYVARNRILIITKNAGLRIIASVWKVTLKEQFIQRVKNIIKAVIGRYPKKQALKEFYRGAKIIITAALLTPYCLGKRYRIIKEDHL